MVVRLQLKTTKPLIGSTWNPVGSSFLNNGFLGVIVIFAQQLWLLESMGSYIVNMC